MSTVDLLGPGHTLFFEQKTDKLHCDIGPDLTVYTGDRGLGLVGLYLLFRQDDGVPNLHCTLYTAHHSTMHTVQ